jgi:DNA-binding NarL/FixJ family response regulator
MIVDDHAVLRQALRLLLETTREVQVIAEATNGREAVEVAERTHPDVVLMDMAMPALNGLEATRQITKRVPNARVLILTGYLEEDHVLTAVRMGASGYCIKRSDVAELLEAIRTVGRGDTYFSPAVTERLGPDFLRRVRTTDEASDPLTSREHEVLQLIAEGYSNQGIADALFISLKTVEAHRAHIMSKLRATSRADLIRYAIRRGIVRVDDPYEEQSGSAPTLAR